MGHVPLFQLAIFDYKRIKSIKDLDLTKKTRKTHLDTKNEMWPPDKQEKWTPKWESLWIQLTNWDMNQRKRRKIGFQLTKNYWTWHHPKMIRRNNSLDLSTNDGRPLLGFRQNQWEYESNMGKIQQQSPQGFKGNMSMGVWDVPWL